MATEVATAEGAASRDATDTTYRTSWMDALVSGIERLPGPTWLAYVAIAGLVVGFIALEGIIGGYAFDLQGLGRFAYAFFFVYPIAAYQGLSLGARDAWDAFRPATGLAPAEAARMRLELSTTPYRPIAVLVALTAIPNLISYFAFPQEFDLTGRPLVYVLMRSLSESFWVVPTSIALIYMVLRQMRLVARLHRTVERVDLVRPGPLHAMSRLTARSAIALIVLAVLTGLPLPGTTEAAWIGTILFYCLPIIVLAAVVFVVPLRGLNRRLVQEKGRMLDVIGTRLHSTTDALHHVLDGEAANQTDADASRVAQTRIDAFNKGLASLLQERDFVRRLSTWPWDGSTFRAVASAIALPIVLFLITRVLDKFL